MELFLRCAVLFVSMNLVLISCDAAAANVDVKLTPSQRQKLLNIAEVLEMLPCEQRESCIYEMTEPPIHLTDGQLRSLAQRFNGSFEDPSDVGRCQDSPAENSEESTSSFSYLRPQRKRRAITPTPPTGTNVCRVTRNDNKVLYLSYSKRGELVYIAQPTIRNGFTQKQLFYESVCASQSCEGIRCSCSTLTVPASKAVVYVIQGNRANNFVESTVMTRTCVAVI